jgi:hypothetical protein
MLLLRLPRAFSPTRFRDKSHRFSDEVKDHPLVRIGVPFVQRPSCQENLSPLPSISLMQTNQEGWKNVAQSDTTHQIDTNRTLATILGH